MEQDGPIGNELDCFRIEAHSALAQLVKDHGLPQQIFHALLACGYSTITSVSKIDDISSIEEFLRDSHELFNAEELTKIYGRFSVVPQKFRFLPGHVAQLEVFIECCRDHSRNETSKRRCDSTSTTSFPKRRLPRQCFPVPISSLGCSSQNADTSLPDNETDDSRPQLLQHTNYDYSSTLSDIQIHLEKWCMLNQDPKVSKLQHNVHYQVIMVIKEHQSDSEGVISSVIACVECCMCFTTINLQPQKDTNFCLSNVYRHLKKCVNKPKRISPIQAQSLKQEDASIVNDHQYEHTLFAIKPSPSKSRPTVHKIVSSQTVNQDDETITFEPSESVDQSQ